LQREYERQGTVCDLECYNEEWNRTEAIANRACTQDTQMDTMCTSVHGDSAPFCKWNETRVGASGSTFGRSETLCTTIECSEDAREMCKLRSHTNTCTDPYQYITLCVQVRHTPHSGDGSGVVKCVCAEGHTRAHALQDGKCSTTNRLVPMCVCQSLPFFALLLCRAAKAFIACFCECQCEYVIHVVDCLTYASLRLSVSPVCTCVCVCVCVCVFVCLFGPLCVTVLRMCSISLSFCVCVCGQSASLFIPGCQFSGCVCVVTDQLCRDTTPAV